VGLLHHGVVLLTLLCRTVFPQDLTYGYYNLRKEHGDLTKPLDWAIVEATAITEDGSIVPGTFSCFPRVSLESDSD
jgi:acyl-CoA hydrolase